MTDVQYSTKRRSTRTHKAKVGRTGRVTQAGGSPESYNQKTVELFSLWDVWDNLKCWLVILWFNNLSKCPGGQAAYLPAAERKVQGTLRGREVSACSWRHRKLPPERLSPGREPHRSAAPTVTHRNCDQRRTQKTHKENVKFSFNVIRTDASLWRLSKLYLLMKATDCCLKPQTFPVTEPCTESFLSNIKLLKSAINRTRQC